MGSWLHQVKEALAWMRSRTRTSQRLLLTCGSCHRPLAGILPGPLVVFAETADRGYRRTRPSRPARGERLGWLEDATGIKLGRPFLPGQGSPVRGWYRARLGGWPADQFDKAEDDQQQNDDHYHDRGGRLAPEDEDQGGQRDRPDA
jgi:hypothetical protein